MELRSRLYGENDLSRLGLFAGGYLNFGYWRDIRTRQLTDEHRVASQEAMYRLLAGAVEIAEGDRVLDVGCGLGRGPALLAREYPVRDVCGVDLLAVQVERAKNINAAAIAAMPGRLHYVEGDASDLPVTDREVHRVLSIESAQHFEDLPAFAAESHRVLSPGGRLGVATFFSTGHDEGDLLAQRLESFAEGIDLAIPVDTFTEVLRRARFTDVTARSIGEHVWPGFDRWLARTSYADAWPREWLGAYEDNLLDYFVVTARKRG